MKYPLNHLLKYGNEPFDIDEVVDFMLRKHIEIRKFQMCSFKVQDAFGTK